MFLEDLASWAFLIPLLMVISFGIVGLAGPYLKRWQEGGWIAVGFAGVAMLLGVLIAAGEMLYPGRYVDLHTTWISVPGNGSGAFPNGFSLVMGTLIDPISALMLIVVNVVGFLVLLYSIEYMGHDKGLARYYAELSLFLAAMNGLVLSDNLLEFFLFWELVGVCSYFLIGFYYEKPSAASAAKEAFLVTRVGDVMFLAGIFVYFSAYATAGAAGGWAANGFLFVNGTNPFIPIGTAANGTLLTIGGLLILGGAAGKSAQFPLHVWLPDAMEGPTTVSALIHAATMVAAGVYLLAVASLFLGFTATDQLAIVAIGGFTCFFAATMAVVNTDIKRVIAYSTISQLGYMVLAVGAGFTMVGLYHLFTHAFFKALLFLAAGAVIHAVGTQDLFKMGGLRKALPLTSMAFLIGALSLSGIPPFAGFWSKDDILGSVYSTLGAHPLYWPFFLMAFATVFLTAYYIFRAWFLAFSGDRPRDPALAHAHEPTWIMKGPLVALSALAVVAGLFAFAPGFPNLLPGVGVPPTYSTIDYLLSGVSVGLALLGLGLAYVMWGNGRVYALAADSPAQSVRTVLLNRYYMKVAYDEFGQRVIYGVARVADFVDRFVIDGAVHGAEHAFAGVNRRMREIQSGIVLDYTAYVVAGLVAVLVLLLVAAPWLLSMWGGSWSVSVPILSLSLVTLLVGTLACFASGRYARYIALATAVAFLVEISWMISQFTWSGFGPTGVPSYAFGESYGWIHLDWLTINYTVGVDGLSLPMLLLTGILLLVTIVYSWEEQKRPDAWFALVLMTCLGCAGVFVSLDILLFFLFWELVLIPMFFMIGYWGGLRRRYAAVKFLVYTHVGSVVMLVSLLVVAFYSGATSFDFSAMYAPARALALVPQVFLFLAMLFGFGVKFPIVPFHTWLPDAHVEAPTGGSVLLAGLLLKLGAYGLIRWGLELLPNGLLHTQPLIFAIAFASIIWGAFVALGQRDLKRMVAYSSINHMGIVLLAIGLYSSLGITAAVLLMFAHGIVSALLFMVAGSTHHSFGTRDLATIRGITPQTPALATVTMVGALASLGLPALISFPAEFLALLATWNGIGYWVFVPLAMLVVTAAFYLWMMQRMLFGPPSGIPSNAPDLPAYESAAMAMLIALTILYGVLPGLLTNVIIHSPLYGLP